MSRKPKQPGRELPSPTQPQSSPLFDPVHHPRASQPPTPAAIPDPPEIEEPLTLHAVAEPSRKRRGEASEAAFLARATSMGFRICTPWGESERYDLVIDYGRGRFYRVQVKCTELFADRRYRVKNGGHSQAVYTPEETDFIAGYVTPLDLWYIVPIEAAGLRKSLRFYPHGARRRNGRIVPSKGLLEKYKNAWCLLDIPRRQRGKKDTPTRCRCQAIPIRCQVCPLLAKLK